MKIRITKKEIKSGICASIFFCPIALAISRKTGRSARVVDGAVFVDCEEYPLPTNARVFVRAFDLGQPVKPIVIELPLEIKQMKTKRLLKLAKFLRTVDPDKFYDACALFGNNDVTRNLSPKQVAGRIERLVKEKTK